MRYQSISSLRMRLLLLAALSAVVALGVAGTAFICNDVRMLSAAKHKQLGHFAALISLNSQRALSMGDHEEAERLLDAMRLDPTIIAACLYDKDGDVVASYLRDVSAQTDFPEPGPESWTRDWGSDEIAVFRNIHLHTDKVGSLFLRSETEDTRRQVNSYALAAGTAMLISLVASCGLAFRLQSSLSGPIDRMLRVANRVGSEGDYSIRVNSDATGDLGELCRAFDSMLNRVQAADAGLQNARDELNRRVHERTRELRREVSERRHAESVHKGQKRVLQQLAAGQPLHEVLTALAAEVESHLRHAHIAIVTVDEQGERLTDPVTATLQRRATVDLQDTPVTVGGNAAARAAATFQAEFDRDLAGAGDPDSALAKSCWALPVIASDGRALAVVVAYVRQDRLPSEEEAALLESAVSLAGVAIEQRQAEAAVTRAMQKATAANRAKSEFLANMSHEIRTPLNSILGFADLMLGERDRLDPEHREYASTIVSSGRHLLMLINDVLDLSKIEAGQVDVETESVDPNEVLVEVMSLLRVRAQEKGIALEYSWETPAPETIRTDSARLRQLLVNLVGNAVKFTDSGSVRVVAALEERGEDGDAMLRVDVHDTGIGIATDKLATIFEPFVQADSSVTRRFGGTGLGLAICKRLSRALGGDVTATSEPGAGSRFTLRVDAGDMRDVPRVASPICDGLLPEPRRVESEGASLTGLRLLVVDDGETNRRLMGIVLRRAGAEVEMAENGREAVEAVLACPFDAILMDMQMPVLDGYSAARKLRAEGVETPILALTAHAMKGDEKKCLDAGCSAYLTKPIEPPLLLQELGRLCGGGGPVCDREMIAQLETDPIYSSLPTDDEEFRDAVVEFLEKNRSELLAMREDLSAGDWGKLRERTHWVKGSGGTAGYAALTNAATDLEGALQGEPDVDRVAQKLEAMERLSERLTLTPVETTATD